MFIINVREIIVNNLIQLKMSGKYDFELKFDKSGNLSFSIYHNFCEVFVKFI